MNEYRSIIGKTVDVVIDRPLGSYHPRTNTIFYTVNYGYVPDVLAGDGSPQDVYILGVDKPLRSFRGPGDRHYSPAERRGGQMGSRPEGYGFLQS